MQCFPAPVRTAKTRIPCRYGYPDDGYNDYIASHLGVLGAAWATILQLSRKSTAVCIWENGSQPSQNEKAAKLELLGRQKESTTYPKSKFSPTSTIFRSMFACG
jgi:hypothetical protein